MMNDSGYIKLHRQIMKWEWYQNPSVFRLFIHLLLSANFVDGRFEGREIRRGQLVTSQPKLATGTLLSVQQVRTALDHLKSTGEITVEQQARYSVITIVKYDLYQADNRLDNRQSTGNQQADNRQTTGWQHQYKNNKNVIREECKENSPTESRGTAKRFTPPTRDDIINFCQENGIMIDPDRFLDYYASRGWKVGTSPMKDWKAAVRNWWRRDGEARPPASSPSPIKQVVAQNYEQRDYSDVQARALEAQRKRLEERMRRQNERDYSDVPGQIVDGLAKEIEQAKKEGTI